MSDEVEVEEVAKVKLAPLKTYVDVDMLKKDVRIDPTDLDTDMIEHASLFVHYAANTVNARRQYDRIKNAMTILEAKLDAAYRESLAADGKKVTEAMVLNAVKSDPRWSAGQAREIDAQSVWKLCEVAENAMVQRKDLLLEIARDRRKEREGQLRVQEVSGMRESVLKLVQEATA